MRLKVLRLWIYDYLFDLNSNFGPILPRFRYIRAFVAESLFSAPHPYSGENFVVFPLEKTRDVWDAKSEHTRLTDGEIISEEFQPM